MSDKTKLKRPSQAWLRAVFESPPRRDIYKVCKSTTVFPHYARCIEQLLYAEGGNENAAMLLLEHLWRQGYVKRFKTQPFFLEEVGGPIKRVPDFLVELWDGRIFVLQIKAHRFCTDEIKSGFETERQLLTSRGFSYLLWTDRTVLKSGLYSNVQLLDLNHRFPPEEQELRAIAIAASNCRTLGDLMRTFKWESIISAIATQHIFVSIFEKFHENTPITLISSHADADVLFRTGTDIYTGPRVLRPASTERWGPIVDGHKEHSAV